MTTRVVAGCLAVLAFLLPGALAQGKDAAGKDAAGKVPRVLLIGDVSLDNHFHNAAKALKGRAEVVRSPLGYLPTGAALLRMDELLAKRKWDLICCNFGLGDLMHKDPQSRRIRAMSPRAGGVPVTGPKEYADNVGRVVARLRKSSDKIVWMTTLPLHPRQRSGAIDAAAIARYNTIASAKMQQCSVAVLDLHAQIADLLAKAKNQRARDHLHNQLFKGDLSAPLVARIVALTKI